MITPIERAAQALQEVPLTGRRILNPDQTLDASRTVFQSIDPVEIADILLAESLFGNRSAMEAALAIKDHLLKEGNGTADTQV